jgi:hypothetical protein
MISLANTNHQNISVCPSTNNEGATFNPDTITGPMTDSKSHSQAQIDSYVFQNYLANNKFILS